MASAECAAAKKAKVLTWQSKLQTAQDFKREGNKFYIAENFKAAIGKYHRAILYVKGIEGASQSLAFANMNPDFEAASKMSDEGKAEVELLKIACYNNLAAALLQVEDVKLDKVVTYCEEVLAMDQNNVKGLYRKGQALSRLRNFEDAIKVLRQATHLPEGEKDVRIRRLLQECIVQYERQEEASRHTYRAMFSQMSIDDSVSNPPRLSSSDSDAQLDEPLS